MDSPRNPSVDRLPRRFGRYMLLRRLAAGGMAELFIAHRCDDRELVVIKKILPSVRRDEAFVSMFLNEARIASALCHPNIVRALEVGCVDGDHYIAMEYLDGEDLRSILDQMAEQGEFTFPHEHALAIVLGVCAGLTHVNEACDVEGNPLGIVHRDISPQNIVITYQGGVRIVDFGLAKGRGRRGEATTRGTLKGKVAYMSPEQARGESIDSRSDVFSAGILLFELTTGRRLFRGRGELETLMLVVEGEYPRPTSLCPGYPKQLERIVMRALEKDRNTRYASADDMRADLEAYVREARVPTSCAELGHWVGRLSSRRIREKTEAVHDVTRLADVVASHQRTRFQSLADVAIPPPPARFAVLRQVGLGVVFGAALVLLALAAILLARFLDLL